MYSRVIVGHSISRDLLTTSTTIVALQIALKKRNAPKGMIIHSDGGGQYYCKEWLQLTTKYEFRNSMCESVYENPHAERINGTIKNDYLVGYGPQNYIELIQMTTKAVMKYNSERPHQSIGNISPYEFEKILTAA